MLRALTLAFLFVAAAPAAAAPPLRLIDRGPVSGTLRSDGERLLAWGTWDGPAELYDLVSKQRRTLVPPPSCTFADVRTGKLLWACGSRGGIVDDLVTGTRTVLAPPPRVDFYPAHYAGFGRSWFRMRQEGMRSDYEFFLERTSGRTVVPRSRDRGIDYDVDVPGLTRRLCRGMWRPMVPSSYIGVDPGPLAIAGRTAAGTTHRDTPDGPDGKVVLQRCGKPARVLQRCRQPTYCTQPVIDDRIVAWNRVRRQQPTLYVRSLRTGLTRSLKPGFGQLHLLDHRLFTTAYGRLVEVTY